jgi:hypothetical protein
VEGQPHAAWAQALEDSALGAVMRDSLVLYPLANLGHIFGLVFFVGSIARLDLRLLGAGRRFVDAAAASRVLTPVALAGLTLQVASGFALFSADAAHTWPNPVFRIKVTLIALGLANALAFRLLWNARLASWDADGPALGRAQAAASLAGWLAVAACGRLIAYF